ncbi:MAG: MBL fold metallo-hydrolase [Armatimonadetes bacterium]|nr:MAG: MBL fold metallo-hydrolase [Armatimonadota bacterium]
MKIEWVRVLGVGLFSFLLLGVIFFYQNGKYYDGKLRVVFCDVGQGDAVFIRTAEGVDILVDGGPDSKVLGCLSSHMPFWDRDLELVFLTHPDSDHSTGLVDVLKRYKVKTLSLSQDVNMDTLVGTEIERIIKEKKIKMQSLVMGDSFNTGDGVRIKTFWPGQGSVLGVNSGDDNNLSLVEGVFYKDFSLLLTGDVEAEILDQILADFENLDVLKVPHHGSKTAFSDKTFLRVKPGIAVISAGKNNRYHHPSGQILSILQEHGIDYKRTDLDGEVEIITDGHNIKYQKSNYSPELKSKEIKN